MGDLQDSLHITWIEDNFALNDPERVKNRDKESCKMSDSYVSPKPARKKTRGQVEDSPNVRKPDRVAGKPVSEKAKSSLGKHGTG